MKKLQVAHSLTLPLDAITQKFAFLGRSGAGKTYGAGKFVEELLDAGAQVVILDPVGNWFGLRLAADGKSPGISIPIFGGDRGDIPLLHTAGALVADLVVDKSISVVLDVHHFRKHERKEFMTQFAEQLFHRKKAARSPMHVVIEEAQVFVPQKAFKGEERLLGAMEDLCKLGRNYGIGNTLISQRPQAVNKDVLNQTGTLFVFNMTGPQERKVMEGWIVEQGVDMTELADDLPSLPTGTAYVWSPQWLGVFEKVKIGAKRTYDASATPVFGKTEKSGTLAPVDLERIQESMKSTIEKAKAEDPRELRKQVALLQKQLVDAQRDKPAAPPAKEKIVEKEVLGDRQVKRLESAIERLDGLREKFDAGLAAVRQEASEIKAAIAKVNKLPAAPPARAATPPSPKAPVHMHAHARPMTERASDNGNLGQGEVKILSAAAQYSDVGVDQAQIAVLTGYKETSRRTYLQRLGSRGYIENRGGRIFATSQGIEALGSDYEPLPTGDALRQYWMERLSGGERTILEVLCQNYPDAVTYAALEEVTGYKETSRRTYLQRLGARRLVTSEAGAARASEELFG